MLMIDLVGIIFTICLVGLRYPHYVLCAVVIHDLGRVLMTLFLHGHLETIVAAGAFGATVVTGVKSGVPALLILFGGAIANYAASATAGGIEYERTRHILNPLARIKHPFAVINLRLAMVSLVVTLWQIFS